MPGPAGSPAVRVTGRAVTRSGHAVPPARSTVQGPLATWERSLCGPRWVCHCARTSPVRQDTSPNRCPCGRRGGVQSHTGASARVDHSGQRDEGSIVNTAVRRA